MQVLLRTTGILSVACIAAAFALALTTSSEAGKPSKDDSRVPDGPGLIAYTEGGADGGVDGGGLITIMNPDGTGKIPVAFTEKGYASPAWSPVLVDGAVKLVWGDTDETTGSFLVALDVFPAIGEPVIIPGSRAIPGSNKIDTIDEVDWTPPVPLVGGRESVRICYQTSADDPDNFRLVRVIVTLIYNPVAGDLMVDTNTLPVVFDAGTGRSFYSSSLSHDGTRIALELREHGNTSSIWIADTDGSNLYPLIDGPGIEDRKPVWSPDGAHLAFISDRDGTDGDIYVAHLQSNGSSLAVTSIDRITATRRSAYNTQGWSPDGQQILYLDNSNLRARLVCKIMLQTGEQYTLAREGINPAWSTVDFPPIE